MKELKKYTPEDAASVVADIINNTRYEGGGDFEIYKEYSNLTLYGNVHVHTESNGELIRYMITDITLEPEESDRVEFNDDELAVFKSVVDVWVDY